MNKVIVELVVLLALVMLGGCTTTTQRMSDEIRPILADQINSFNIVLSQAKQYKALEQRLSYIDALPVSEQQNELLLLKHKALAKESLGSAFFAQYGLGYSAFVSDLAPHQLSLPDQALACLGWLANGKQCTGVSAVIVDQSEKYCSTLNHSFLTSMPNEIRLRPVWNEVMNFKQVCIKALKAVDNAELAEVFVAWSDHLKLEELTVQCHALQGIYQRRSLNNKLLECAIERIIHI